MQKGIERVCIELKGLNVDILGICLRDEKYAYDGGIDSDEAIEQVKAYRQNADVVIVSVHWGDELIEYPGLRQRRLARQFQDAGADVVMGHHPHVFQGLDRIESTVVAYSLGNFIFDGFSAATGWSIILSITIKPDKTLAYEAIPIVRDESFRPQIAHGSQKAQLLEEIQRRNEGCRIPIENEEQFSCQYNTLSKQSKSTLEKSGQTLFYL